MKVSLRNQIEHAEVIVQFMADQERVELLHLTRWQSDDGIEFDLSGIRLECFISEIMRQAYQQGRSVGRSEIKNEFRKLMEEE